MYDPTHVPASRGALVASSVTGYRAGFAEDNG
jgi:hypothetical protein